MTMRSVRVSVSPQSGASAAAVHAGSDASGALSQSVRTSTTMRLVCVGIVVLVLLGHEVQAAAERLAVEHAAVRVPELELVAVRQVRDAAAW